ncbi:MAG: CPBP family intramembrane glutamic endopeptidase, partial [Pseudomonadota bacterium]
EIAYRVVLMRGLQASFGGTTSAAIIALLIQAVIFGFAHYYNGGQMAVLRTGFNSLVYGALVLSARGVVWPAVIAHGLHNTINLTLGYLPETD